VGGQAEALEAAARAGDLKRVQAENDTFIRTTETLLVDLKALLREAFPNNRKKERAAAPDAALLDKLLEACKRYVPSRMENIIMELEKYDYESEGDLVLNLRGQLDNLEYDAIRKCLEARKVLT
jgi:hypothetical protein